MLSDNKVMSEGMKSELLRNHSLNSLQNILKDYKFVVSLSEIDAAHSDRFNYMTTSHQ